MEDEDEAEVVVNAPGIRPGVELVLDEREVVLLEGEDTVELELEPERVDEVEVDAALSWIVTEDELDAALEEDATGEYM